MPGYSAPGARALSAAPGSADKLVAARNGTIMGARLHNCMGRARWV